MPSAKLEHVNFTATDPKATAALLCEIFDWRIRWEGAAINDGYTVHVGDDDSYVAVYSRGGPGEPPNSYETKSGLNHIGIVVKDIDAIEEKVKRAGLKPHSHADYEPGQRFYFYDPDGVEFEVVSYV